MGWMDKLKEGVKGLTESDIGKGLAQQARDKAEAGLDQILGGKKQEGEQLISDAAKDAEAARKAGETSEDTADVGKSAGNT